MGYTLVNGHRISGRYRRQLEDAISFYTSAGDDASLAIAHYHLGKVMLNMANLNGALDHLNEAADLARTEDPSSLPAIYSVLGRTHALAGRSDLALDYFERAYHLFPTDDTDRVVHASHMVDYFEGIGRFDLAHMTFHEVLSDPIFDPLDEQHGLAALRHAARMVEHCPSDIDQAYNLLDAVATTLERSESAVVLQKYHRYRADLMTALGDYREAFDAQQRYTSISDSLLYLQQGGS